jgi:hypothetical protein
MQATNPHPDVPPLAGALSVAGPRFDDISDWRHFRRTKRGAAETRCGNLISVDITGDQFSEGYVDRRIDICDTYRLDPSGARALAADLIAAANELDEGRR